MPANYRGKSLYVYPFDPIRLQSRHAAQYAALVGNELGARGFVILKDKAALADYTAWMDFAVDSGHEKVASWDVTGFAPSGGTSAPYSARVFLAPNYGVVGEETESHAEYGRFFTIAIVDRAGSSPGHPKVVYEARAASEGREKSLSRIVPSMIHAIFKDFPARSGSVTTSTQSGN
jgi:hypothetical protein